MRKFALQSLAISYITYESDNYCYTYTVYVVALTGSAMSRINSQIQGVLVL